jgi:hypothetical protein
MRLTFLAISIGFVGGWAARSLSDTPQGAGVKLLEIAMNARERISRWAAVEGERLEDMLAEARSAEGRSKVEANVSRPRRAVNGSGNKTKSGKRRASPTRQGPRLVKRDEGT